MRLEEGATPLNRRATCWLDDPCHVCLASILAQLSHHDESKIRTKAQRHAPLIMEVVGLVLSVYPVVILAFEQFKTGSEYFSNWKRFRRQYEGFLSDIAGQRLLFEGILQDLLCGGFDPYLSGINSKEAFLRIVSDKSYTCWSDPKLTENLKARLGKSYNWYMNTIGRIYDIFKDFEEIIDIQAVGRV